MNNHFNYIDNYEKSISLMILSCLNDLELQVGKKKTVAILQGSESNYIFKNDFNKNPFYGLLQNYNFKQINDIIERLIVLDLIEFKSLDIEFYSNVLELTSKGIHAIRTGKIESPKITNILVHLKSSDLINYDLDLFDKLRNVRKEISQSINKPAFIVCHDKVLRQIAIDQPKDDDSFLAIKGIGKYFIQNYSSLFINEIELHRDSFTNDIFSS
jgi:ATP-dependent DNA helicase RecQ